MDYFLDFDSNFRLFHPHTHCFPGSRPLGFSHDLFHGLHVLLFAWGGCCSDRICMNEQKLEGIEVVFSIASPMLKSVYGQNSSLR